MSDPTLSRDHGGSDVIELARKCGAVVLTNGVDHRATFSDEALRAFFDAAQDVAAAACETVLDLKEEARADKASHDALGTDEELSRLQHWATVSTFNAGVRRCIAAIRNLPEPQ